mmetsp:Transcript_3089/g.7161  ORF Transcript_3089/g.7161 Transcript_3089/m.7161 type:complete len:498 (+) Transcript_3089:335-1828(+)
MNSHSFTWFSFDASLFLRSSIAASFFARVARTRSSRRPARSPSLFTASSSILRISACASAVSRRSFATWSVKMFSCRAYAFSRPAFPRRSSSSSSASTSCFFTMSTIRFFTSNSSPATKSLLPSASTRDVSAAHNRLSHSAFAANASASCVESFAVSSETLSHSSFFSASSFDANCFSSSNCSFPSRVVSCSSSQSRFCCMSARSFSSSTVAFSAASAAIRLSMSPISARVRSRSACASFSFFSKSSSFACFNSASFCSSSARSFSRASRSCASNWCCISSTRRSQTSCAFRISAAVPSLASSSVRACLACSFSLSSRNRSRSFSVTRSCSRRPASRTSASRRSCLCSRSVCSSCFSTSNRSSIRFFSVRCALRILSISGSRPFIVTSLISRVLSFSHPSRRSRSPVAQFCFCRATSFVWSSAISSIFFENFLSAAFSSSARPEILFVISVFSFNKRSHSASCRSACSSPSRFCAASFSSWSFRMSACACSASRRCR